ncbi:hypothetical protein ACVIWV_010449 [Bradyrhizobium diazoefficiens]
MWKRSGSLLLAFALAAGALSSAYAADGSGTQRLRAALLLPPKTLENATPVPYTRVDTATCICDGIPFQASCPSNQRVTCKCGPPGYSCSN